MRITHLGHSCLLVEAADERVLIDPGVFSHGFEELTKLSAVLVTHEHPDHLDVSRLPTLLEANDGTRLFAEAETAAQLAESGIEAGRLHGGEPVTLGRLTVRALISDHGTIHPDIPAGSNAGLLFEADGEPKLFVPGDSLATVPDGVEILALPLAGPWSSATVTIDFARAVGAPLLFPVHDELLSPSGRGLYINLVTQLTPPSTQVVDIKGAGPTDF